jgi:hypothetical protein
MAYVLRHARSKAEVDEAILGTMNKVLVLRFGRDDDPGCMVLDDIVCSYIARLASLLLDYDDQRGIITVLTFGSYPQWALYALSTVYVTKSICCGFCLDACWVD